MSISIIFPIDFEGETVELKKNSFGISSYADQNPSEAIRQNLKMLLLTRQGEYVMDANFGVGLPEYLFETAVTISFPAIEQKIRTQVATYMPYMTLQAVSVVQGDDEMTMRVRIEFFYNEQQMPEVFELEVI
jgi:phage baseplate assembly protein W